MSCLKLLSSVAAMLIAGCGATAQSSLTNIFKNLDKVILASPALGGSDTQGRIFTSPGVSYVSDSNGSKAPASWIPAAPAIDLESFLGTDVQTSLRGSFVGTTPKGETLFLSDLDFGEQGAFVKWDTSITVVPEPSSWVFVGLGGAVLAVHFMRRLGAR